jgi:hypothetical protein
VVSTCFNHLEKDYSVGIMIPNIWENNHVPNYQPDIAVGKPIINNYIPLGDSLNRVNPI